MPTLRTVRAVAAAVAVALLAVASAVPAAAGRSCAAHTVSVAELTSAIDMAQRVRATLDRRAHRFALLARVGDDISAYGLKYTHVGIARKRAADGAWMVVQELNPCATDRATLHVHGLADFMLDDLFSHDVLIVTLEGSLEDALERVFARDDPHRVYEPEYSMIAYPGMPPRYQNSNQWVLEIIAQAQADRDGARLGDRRATHAYYRRHGFRGSMIRVSALRRSLARTFAANVRFDDHPAESQRRGTYEVVSVKAMVDYLRRSGDARQVIELKGTYRRPRPDAGTATPDGAAEN